MLVNAQENIQLYKQLNKRMDQFQNFPFFGIYDFHPLSSENHNLTMVDFQQFNKILAENARITAENISLTQKIEILTQKNKKLRNQNLHLKRQQLSQFKVEKRRYTPRRKGLLKNIHCDIEGCSKIYSSGIALRNHQRDVHKLRKR